jgi:hypothetical protein
MPATVPVERTFSVRGTTSPALDGQVGKPLSAFFDEPALVVLGDPGAGKTTVFRGAAAIELGAEFVTVRDFLTLDPSRWRGKTLYLDGLDEVRIRSNDGAGALDGLRSRLDALGQPRVRLSCRGADWYGSSDLERLVFVTKDGRATTLALDPLTDADIETIAADAVTNIEAFLADATARGVGELLRNPLTLRMLLEVLKNGQWPSSRSELYARAADALVQELNPEHARFQASSVSPAEILNASGAISATLICGGARGAALTMAAATVDFPYLGRLPAPLNVSATAARSRLFVSDGNDRVTPIHRTIADYIAARYLASQVHDGLPVGRVLALLTGHDGGVVTDLRGLFAWLATTLPEHARLLIARDPLGVALYGDAAALRPSDRPFLLQQLSLVAARDPWFRAGNWHAPALGGLATEDMLDPFSKILADSSASTALTATVLESLRYGAALVGLIDPLLGIIRDNTRPDYLRVEALKALNHISPDAARSQTLLDELRDGRIADEERRLRGVLLRTLFPAVLRATEVVPYLVAPSPHVIGEYTMFVEYELLQQTPSSDLPDLLDGVARRLPLRRGDHFERFLGRLLGRGLQEHGATVATPRLWVWLGVALGPHAHPRIDAEYQAEIKNWLSSHTDRARDLLLHWAGSLRPADLPREYWTFLRRLHGATFGSRYGHWLLDLAASETDPLRADFFFREAVRDLTVRSAADSPTVEDLFDFVEARPRFKEALADELRWRIDDWRTEAAEHRKEARRRQNDAREQNARSLGAMIEQLRCGAALGPLAYLGRIYFGLFVDVDREAAPMTRLANFAGPELAADIAEGFKRVLVRSDLPTPTMIGALHLKSRTYGLGYAVLAGCDLIAGDSVDALAALPDDTLKSAFAFHLSGTTYPPPSWAGWLRRERAALAASAAEAFWAAQLGAKMPSISGLHDLVSDPGIASLITFSLLRRFPLCHETSLRLLLTAAIKHCEHAALLELCRGQLTDRKLRGERRTVWLATGYALSPSQFAEASINAIRRAPERARAFTGFLFSIDRGAGSRLPNFCVSDRASLIRALGPMFPPKELTGGWQRSDSDWDMAQRVRTLVDGLANTPSPDAGAALSALSEDRHLAAWRDTLVHALELQTRNRREALFRYAPLESVVDTLAGGRPANAADLQALVASELATVAEEIRNGVTDGYKAFWNVDRHDRPTTPRPEDDCRDRLLERLQLRLNKNGVALEPEGRYAEHKRADIKAIAGSLNIPVELKRHYHPDLWTAPAAQLHRQYIRDPGTSGRGAFVVIWFGTEVATIPRPPHTPEKLQSPEALMEALETTITPEQRVLIDFQLVDCHAPDLKRRAYAGAPAGAVK